MKTLFAAVFLFAALNVLAKPYKGAEVYSNQSWKYGKMEMRMKMAKGSGILSTFFTYKNGSEMSGAFWEEIDIEVFGKDNAQSFQSNILSNNPKKSSEQVHALGYSLGDAYHTYTLEWTPNYVAWYIDGVLMRRSQGGQVNELTSPESFRFNLWAVNNTNWVGAFDTNVLPVYQFVNWMKYSAYTPGTGNNGTDFTLSWTDDFDTFNTSRWSKADWTFNENLTDFDPNNVAVKDGCLVLVLSNASQTGFTATVPKDQATQPVPTVSLTSPADNAKFCTGNTITISADASVSSGSIAKVDFYDGSTLLGTDNSSPYSYSWVNAAAGTKTIRAIATSTAQAASPAASANITINSPTAITPRIQTDGTNWLPQNQAAVCAGAAVAMGQHSGSATGWSWTGPQNFAGTAREISLNPATAAQAGKYTATFVNDAGCTSTTEYSLTVHAIPSAPIVISPVTYKQNTSAAALTATGTALKWYETANTATPSAAAPVPSTANIGSTSYFVTQTVNTCESPRAQIDVVTKAAPITQNIGLDAGWNLISINVHPTDSTIATLFAGLDVLEIKDMDAFWRKGQNDAFNGLKTITPGAGYLVNMNAAGTLSVTGVPVETRLITSLPTNGWNLIGCPYPAAAPIVGIFARTFLLLKDFEGFNIPGSANNTILNIEPGKGYFVK